MSYQENVALLRRRLLELESAVVAFSGGVDSALLTMLAYQELKDKMCAATAVSASLPIRDRNNATTFCREYGIPHVFVETDEFENPSYIANPNDRCFYCKSALYDRLSDLAKERDFQYVVEGTNASDLSFHRPGYKASLERKNVVTPLIDVGMTKEDVRRLARELNLPVAEKPASACLSSRIPEGVPLGEELLKKIDDAEEAIRAKDIAMVRVRHHSNIARIEISPTDFPTFLNHREELVAKFKDLGYKFVTLDLIGYRSGGSAN